jgi:amino acid transporter
VNKPVRTYFFSIVIAFLLTITVYFLAVSTALSSGMDLSRLAEQGFPGLGLLLGGRWLAVVIAIGGMASTIGLFSAVLLSISRVPKAMADDGLLPRVLNATHRKFKTPYVSIIVSAVIVSGMVLWKFGDLVIIDITVYGGALFLEFISLIVFRLKIPNEPRPFRIPLNVVGLCVMVLLPFAVYSIALSSAVSTETRVLTPVLFAMGALLSAEVVWRIIVWFRKKAGREMLAERRFDSN